MRKPRVFRGSLFMGGTDWREVLGLERHDSMVTALVLCPLKSHAEEAFRARRISVYDNLRVDEHATDMLAIREAGLLQPDGDPVIYYMAQKDRAIARVLLSGHAEVIAHWRYESGRLGRGLWIEPV